MQLAEGALLMFQNGLIVQEQEPQFVRFRV